MFYHDSRFFNRSVAEPNDIKTTEAIRNICLHLYYLGIETDNGG
jgi:hypothetical protein